MTLISQARCNPIPMFQDTVKEMLKLAQNYDKALEEEDKMTPEQLAIKNVGKQDPKRHLEDKVDVLMTTNIVQVRTENGNRAKALLNLN